MTNVQRALESLGAVEVAPDRYASENLLGIGWWSYSRERVEALANDILDPRVLWWPALYAVKMPSWWKPERRFRKCEDEPEGCGRYCITADLITGEEIPA